MRKLRHKKDVLTVSNKEMVKVSCHLSVSHAPTHSVPSSAMAFVTLDSHYTLVFLTTL